MDKEFLGKDFEFGGTLENLDNSKGNYSGVYLIVCPSDFTQIVFKPQNSLKFYREKDISLSIDELWQLWVENANILYIGRRITKTVRSRVQNHIKFWSGQPSPAKGGRIIGQIQDWQKLEAYYLKCDNPKQMKNYLLNMFESIYGKLPFANLKN